MKIFHCDEFHVIRIKSGYFIYRFTHTVILSWQKNKNIILGIRTEDIWRVGEFFGATLRGNE